jgi:two-component system, OmpR family, sensor histidine kinase VicK
MEKTEVIYTQEKTFEVLFECLSETNDRWDVYADSAGASAFYVMHEIKEAYLKALRRGIKIRVLTEVTENNMFYCNDDMRYVSEVRHMEGVTGFYIISDSYYISFPLQYPELPISYCVFSNAKQFVNMQQDLFTNLWKRTISIDERFKELEV